MQDQERRFVIMIERGFAGTEPLSVINVKGILDSENSQYFHTTVLENLPAPTTGHLILNLEGLARVGPAGMGALTAIQNRITGIGGVFILCGLNPAIQGGLNLVGMGGSFLITEDINSARVLLAEQIALRTGGGTDSRQVFPIVFACRVCGRRLKVQSAGLFRCVDCKSVLSVTEEGNVETAIKNQS